MFKRAVTFVIVFFIVSTIVQWVVKSEVRLIDNIAISIIAFFFFILFERISKSKKQKKTAK